MSLYSDLITLLRADVSDFPIRRMETADGDNSTAVFNVQNSKVLEGSDTIQVSGVTKAEITDYTVDRNVGQYVFNAGHLPGIGNDIVSFQYKSVNMLDSDWVDIVNQVLSNLRKKIWIEVLDSTTLTAVTDQFEYDLAAVKAANGNFTDVIWVIDWEYELATNAPINQNAGTVVTNPWRPVSAITNVRYFKDLQKLHIRPAFNTSGFPMRLRLARAYIQGSSSSSTLEVQQRYWSVVRKFCQAEYWTRMIPLAFRQTAALSKEKTFENVKALRDLANDLRTEAEKELARVRMTKPAKMIPTVIYGMDV